MAGGPADRQTGALPSPAASLPTVGRLLGIDPGAKHVGLALSDPQQRLAHPLATLTRRPGRRFPLAALRPLLEAHAPVGIVMGLPVDPGGAEGPRAAEARATGNLLNAKTGLPVTYVDERFTTALARRAFEGVPRRARPGRAAVDRMAATVLLQAFLDRRP
ncbi:MAG TPA: Holliday junction resolvase RuvX [Gemmatimonadales bacterium]|nr:Holliday junction resolvase RuvX [Gemmatimonadales bacterium]